MISTAFYFKGYRCFKNEWAGFKWLKPVNVIIGRNNSGKSHLLRLVESIAAEKFLDDIEYRFAGFLDETSLKSTFREGTHGGKLGGDFWQEHGQKLIGLPVQWTFGTNGKCHIDSSCYIGFDPSASVRQPKRDEVKAERIKMTERILEKCSHELSKKIYRHLAADRDVRLEKESNDLELSPLGEGATNIIRRLLVTYNESLPTELIQGKFLEALNQIFGEDAHFTEIRARHHDEKVDEEQKPWEIYLREEHKGLIPLSQSGSGLKTVLLVLLNLLAIPDIQKNEPSKYVFCFEELENNLHPSLQRRLLQFIEDYAVENESTVFLTTHSSAALDLFGPSEHAQIVHVTHDGKEAKVQTVEAHFDKLGIISELGAKPSDLLQANGVVWVEGPSDCIYLNRWIHLASNGELKEGRHYQCAFYGGALLARMQFTSPEEAETEFVNLLRVNPNIAVICDGDRSAPGKHLKGRVRRIKPQVEKIPNSHLWITEAREIENYIPGEVLKEALETGTFPDPEQYQSFFPRKSDTTKSYVERRLGKNRIDKIELAAQTAPHMIIENMAPRFDWEKEMKALVKTIEGWNQ